MCIRCRVPNIIFIEHAVFLNLDCYRSAVVCNHIKPNRVIVGITFIAFMKVNLIVYFMIGIIYKRYIVSPYSPKRIAKASLKRNGIGVECTV